ncbi:MAG: HEAT repeat domain-containing protein [Pirellulales bacterium]|nr:HEAT repeat domain-containing protein [Pirellulales bacterium]
MSLDSAKLPRFSMSLASPIILSGLIAVALSGCNGFGNSAPGWMSPPWSNKTAETADEGTGIKPPYQRMAELRELAKAGPSMSPDEQQRIGHQLAEEYRVEQDPLIRTQMVRTLTGFKTDEASAVLREAMEDGSIDVRIAACQTWGARGGPEAIELLGQRIAADTSADVRLAASRALGETRDPNAVAKLALALDDADPALQHRAVLSLRKITGKTFDNDVNQWRQYVKGEPPTPSQPTSLAERLRRLF